MMGTFLIAAQKIGKQATGVFFDCLVAWLLFAAAVATIFAVTTILLAALAAAPAAAAAAAAVFCCCSAADDFCVRANPRCACLAYSRVH